jgi:putative hydrolase of the HAD superfamily
MKHVRRAVIFDLYGTLVDLEVNEDTLLFWNALASDLLGSERRVSGKVLQDAFMRLVRKVSGHIGEGFMLDTVFSGMLEELGLIPTPDNISAFAEKFRKYSITHLSKKNYADDLLCAIRTSGYQLGLVSNTEALLTAYDLKVLSFPERFDAIVLSSSVGVKKPDKRIFEIILGRLGAQPKDCVFVGDTFDDDIAGALNAGIDTVFLTASTSVTSVCGDEHRGRIVCAGFDLKEIIGALRRIGFAISSSVE